MIHLILYSLPVHDSTLLHHPEYRWLKVKYHIILHHYGCEFSRWLNNWIGYCTTYVSLISFLPWNKLWGKFQLDHLFTWQPISSIFPSTFDYPCLGHTYNIVSKMCWIFTFIWEAWLVVSGVLERVKANANSRCFMSLDTLSGKAWQSSLNSSNW